MSQKQSTDVKRKKDHLSAFCNQRFRFANFRVVSSVKHYISTGAVSNICSNFGAKKSINITPNSEPRHSHRVLATDCTVTLQIIWYVKYQLLLQSTRDVCRQFITKIVYNINLQFPYIWHEVNLLIQMITSA